MLKISTNNCPAFTGKSGGKLRRLTDSLIEKPLQYSIVFFELPPGGIVGEHYHKNGEESYYVISGAAEVDIMGASYSITTGDLFHIPSDTPHSLKNNGNENLCILAIFSPPDALENSVYSIST